MQQDFYTVEDLATQLLGSAFVNLNNIPDFRLRSMLHILEMALNNPEGQKTRDRSEREGNLTGGTVGGSVAGSRSSRKSKIGKTGRQRG